MKSLAEIDLGYGDATNYRKNKRMAQMFNEIFVKDRNLERLLQEDSFFLLAKKVQERRLMLLFWKTGNIRIQSLRYMKLVQRIFRSF